MATQDKPISTTRSMTSIEDVEQLFNNFFRRGWLSPFSWDRPLIKDIPLPFEGRTPHIDVVDRDDTIIIKAELPGVDKKDLDITVTDTSLTIKGSTRTEKKEEKGDYYCKEISSASYARTISLPATVDGSKAKSSFKDGMLEISLPKIEKSLRHSIKVD